MTDGYRDAPPPNPPRPTRRHRFVPSRAQVEVGGGLLAVALFLALAGLEIVRATRAGAVTIAPKRIVLALLIPWPLVASALRVVWPHFPVLRTRMESGEFDDGWFLGRPAYVAIIAVLLALLAWGYVL